jgi:hypothetical protein
LSGRLQREPVAVMAGKEQVGNHDGGDRHGHGSNQMSSPVRQRERVERDRRCDHGDRPRVVVDGKHSEHEPAGEDERRGRCAPAQQQHSGGSDPERERERTRRRVGPHGNDAPR